MIIVNNIYEAFVYISLIVCVTLIVLSFIGRVKK